MLESKEFSATIEFARKLHGHVGPYLVIGLKMGAAAKKALSISDTEHMHLTAEAAVPLHPPFSCLLDGIQVSTTCTVGNRRLKIKSSKNIQATFGSKKDSKTVKITLADHFSEQLQQKLKQHALNEAFAWELADLPESQLFHIALE